MCGPVEMGVPRCGYDGASFGIRATDGVSTMVLGVWGQENNFLGCPLCVVGMVRAGW
jgi:hypothetical protein